MGAILMPRTCKNNLLHLTRLETLAVNISMPSARILMGIDSLHIPASVRELTWCGARADTVSPPPQFQAPDQLEYLACSCAGACVSLDLSDFIGMRVLILRTKTNEDRLPLNVSCTPKLEYLAVSPGYAVKLGALASLKHLWRFHFGDDDAVAGADGLDILPLFERGFRSLQRGYLGRGRILERRLDGNLHLRRGHREDFPSSF